MDASITGERARASGHCGTAVRRYRELKLERFVVGPFNSAAPLVWADSFQEATKVFKRPQ